MSRDRVSRLDPELVKKLYTEIDLDGDGLVQRGELIKAIRKREDLDGLVKLPKGGGALADIEDLFTQMDVDHSGSISLDEFTMFLKELQHRLDENERKKECVKAGKKYEPKPFNAAEMTLEGSEEEAAPVPQLSNAAPPTDLGTFEVSVEVEEEASSVQKSAPSQALCTFSHYEAIVVNAAPSKLWANIRNFKSSISDKIIPGTQNVQCATPFEVGALRSFVNGKDSITETLTSLDDVNMSLSYRMDTGIFTNYSASWSVVQVTIPQVASVLRFQAKWDGLPGDGTQEIVASIGRSICQGHKAAAE